MYNFEYPSLGTPNIVQIGPLCRSKSIGKFSLNQDSYSRAHLKPNLKSLQKVSTNREAKGGIKFNDQIPRLEILLTRIFLGQDTPSIYYNYGNIPLNMKILLTYNYQQVFFFDRFERNQSFVKVQFFFNDSHWIEEVMFAFGGPGRLDRVFLTVSSQHNLFPRTIHRSRKFFPISSRIVEIAKLAERRKDRYCAKFSTMHGNSTAGSGAFGLV